MKLFQWIGGFFEDQTGSASAKRSTLYIAMFFLYMLVKGSLDGKIVDENILYVVAFIALWCVGAITSEFLAMFINRKKDEQREP